MGRYAFYSLRKRRIYSTMVFGSGGLFTLVSLSHLLMRALTTLSASRSSLGSTGGSPKSAMKALMRVLVCDPLGSLPRQFALGGSIDSFFHSNLGSPTASGAASRV